jgi:hypothetical protein
MPQRIDAPESRTESALRRALNGRQPRTMAEAKTFSLECVGRAEAVAAVLVCYTWEQELGTSPKAWSVVRQCLELIDDLCHVAYPPMLDGWPDKEGRDVS